MSATGGTATGRQRDGTASASQAMAGRPSGCGSSGRPPSRAAEDQVEAGAVHVHRSAHSGSTGTGTWRTGVPTTPPAITADSDPRRPRGRDVAEQQLEARQGGVGILARGHPQADRAHEGAAPASTASRSFFRIVRRSSQPPPAAPFRATTDTVHPVADGLARGPGTSRAGSPIPTWRTCQVMGLHVQLGGDAGDDVG
jgi:hypothetical protein